MLSKKCRFKKKWIKAIPRKFWKVTNHHRVCLQHFTKDDFIHILCNKNEKRKNFRKSNNLLKLRLKLLAIPHVFPSFPYYLKKTKISTRTTSASASARCALENAAEAKQNEEFFMSEILIDFASFQQKIKSEILPSGFASVSGKDCQAFHYFKYYDIGNYQDAPKLLSSVIVTLNLDVHVYVYSTLIPPSSYHHITSSSKPKAISELTNLLAFCKSFCENFSENQNQCNFIALAVSLLESTIFSEAHLIKNPDSFSLIQFVIK